MSNPHDLVAFPLLALSALVAVAIAIAGGELIRRLLVYGVLGRLGLTHHDLDGDGSSARTPPVRPPGTPAPPAAEAGRVTPR